MPPWILAALASVLWLVSAATSLPGGLAGEAPDPPGPAAPQPRPSVVLKKGRLWLDVRARTLGFVLEEISQKAGVPILLAEALHDRPFSLQLQDVPLEAGLRELLKEEDVFFFYSAEKAPSSLKAVWVYPKGQGRGLEPVPPEQWASTRELERWMADRDAAVRSRAVAALIERKREGASEVVQQALRDDDERVRTQALHGALSSGLELPTAALLEALDDPSADVRFLTLEALAERPGAGEIAARALDDPSPHVREKAQEILSQLKAKGETR